MHANDDPITSHWFKKKLTKGCGDAGISKVIKGHSIRIDAAPEAVKRGSPFHIIQDMG